MLNHICAHIGNAFPKSEVRKQLLSLAVTGRGDLPSWFAVSDLATAVIGTAGGLVAQLVAEGTERLPRVSVDRVLASYWFKSTVRPVGWKLPPTWNAVAGNYRAKDGWIRLHTNVPAHLSAALAVLGVSEERAAVSRAVERWEREKLMHEIINAGGCAAVMNSIDDWRVHPQGIASAHDPLILWQEHEPIEPAAKTLSHRPLAGLRVLDLTRILAGPVATRFLAAYGADVLRIDPPHWDEPAAAPEVTLGKRCANLDLRIESGKLRFERLVREADILVHGYRPGALDRLGYDGEKLRSLNPGLINVSLNAYGWSGPWSNRRGFDSLVQMSCGIAAYGMMKEDANGPVPLPVQALDHATGYLMAAAALHALRRRHVDGDVLSARLSLARTAHLLISAQLQQKGSGLRDEEVDDLNPTVEKTTWGNARRLRFPLVIDGIEAQWLHPASKLGTAEPVWQ